MRRIAFSLSLLAAATVAAADPYIAYVYPVAVQAGTTNKLMVGGQSFQGQLFAMVSGKGVTVLNVTKVPGMPPTGGSQTKYLKGWLDSIAVGIRSMPALPNDSRISEWRECSWWRHLDELDDMELAIVERHLYVPRNGLQMSPSLKSKVLITIAVAPDAEPGRRDLLLCSPSAASAPHALFVTAAPHVLEPLYLPPHRRPPGKPQPTPVTASLPVSIDGQIMPGETDRFSFSFSKGQRIRFSLIAREVLPYIGDAVPGFFNAVIRLVGPNDQEVAFADDNGFNPDPTMTVEIPSSGDYILEVRDNLYRGREDFVYTVAVENAEIVADRLAGKAASPRADAKHAEDAEHFSGVIDVPGKIAKHSFCIKEPGLRVIEASARKEGSQLDPVISLYGPGDRDANGGIGPEIATWDDTTNSLFVGAIAQAECDPKEYHNFKEPGRYTLAVRDRVNGGGKNHSYSITVRPPAPDFTVYATRSSFPALKKDKAKVKFKVVRHDGFDGEVKILNTPELFFTPSALPACSNEISVTAFGRLEEAGRNEIEIFAEGLINGEPARRRIIPTDEEEQAFAWTHLIPARTFFCTYAKNLPKPPRPDKWPRLPDKPFADIPRGTNIVFDVMANASPEEMRETISRRHLRYNKLIRARTDTELKRTQMNRLICAGVTEFDLPDGNPIRDPYAMRLMGEAQNAVPDNDILVYAPSSHLAAAHAAVTQLKREGWCAELLLDERIAAISPALSYRIVFVPATIPCKPETAKAILARLGGVNGTLAFEKEIPDGVGDKFIERRNCRVCPRGPGRRPKITCGNRRDALIIAWGRCEPFSEKTGLRFSRWKDGDETVYFVFNASKERTAHSLKLNGKVATGKSLNPSNGAIMPLPIDNGEIKLSLAPGESRWLRIYPFN